jgi:dihydrofolate reductase
MRPVCYSVAASLDGFIAGPNGEFDWIPMDPDIDFGALFARFDTLLLGRRTWEAVRRQGGPGMAGMKSYVFSTTLGEEDCPGAVLSRDPRITVEALKQEGGKAIWLFGGGSLFRSLLELGLVDRVQVGLVPVLVGDGLPLVEHPARLTRLKLTQHRLYPKTGTVLLDYDVLPPAAPGGGTRTTAPRRGRPARSRAKRNG